MTRLVVTTPFTLARGSSGWAYTEADSVRQASPIKHEPHLHRKGDIDELFMAARYPAGEHAPLRGGASQLRAGVFRPTAFIARAAWAPGATQVLTKGSRRGCAVGSYANGLNALDPLTRSQMNLDTRADGKPGEENSQDRKSRQSCEDGIAVHGRALYADGREAEVRTSDGRRYPSDHLPVTATLLSSRVASLPNGF